MVMKMMIIVIIIILTTIIMFATSVQVLESPSASPTPSSPNRATLLPPSNPCYAHS